MMQLNCHIVSGVSMLEVLSVFVNMKNPSFVVVVTILAFVDE